MTTAVADRSLDITFFPNLTDTTPTRETYHLAAFIKLLTAEPTLAPSTDESEKNRGRLFSAATYKPGFTRGVAGVEKLHALVLDYDGPKNAEKESIGITPQEVEAIFAWLEQTDYIYVAYNTFTSGCVSPNEKLRIVLFFDEPVLPKDYKRVWQAVTDTIPVKIDKTSNEYSRAFYLPRIPVAHKDHYDSSTGGSKLLNVKKLLVQPTGLGFSLNDIDMHRAPADWAKLLRETDNKWDTLRRAAYGLGASAALAGKPLEQAVETIWQDCRTALEHNPSPVKDWAHAERTCRGRAEAGWSQGESERPSLPEEFRPTEKQIHRATQALKSAVKLVSADSTQLNNQAYLVGRYTPHVLSVDHVVEALSDAASINHSGGNYVEKPEAVLKAQAAVTAGQKHPHFAQPKNGWRAKLAIDSETGARAVCDANAKIILRDHPDMLGKLRWNVRKDAAVLVDSPPWESVHEKFPAAIDVTDGYDASLWLSNEKVLGGKPMAGRTVFEAMHAVAVQDKYDPFADWLLGLKWDGAPRLDNWLCDYGGAEACRYVQLAAKNFLIGAVALTLDPDANASDTVLVLAGKENLGKSRLLLTLSGEEYFTDGLRDITDKDSYLLMQSHVIVEIAELDKLMQYDDADVKSFLTARRVKIRPAYGRVAIEVLRRAVVAATTNEPEFLKSTTGNRRFIPIRCRGKCDYEGLSQVRDQLWAEALERYKAGEKWWLQEEADFEEATKIQEAARLKDELEFELDFLEGVRPAGAIDYNAPQGLTEQKRMEVYPEQFDADRKFLWVTIRQVCDFLGKDGDDLRIQRRVGKALRLAGWEKTETIWLETGKKARVFKKS